MMISPKGVTVGNAKSTFVDKILVLCVKNPTEKQIDLFKISNVSKKNNKPSCLRLVTPPILLCIQPCSNALT